MASGLNLGDDPELVEDPVHLWRKLAALVGCDGQWLIAVVLDEEEDAHGLELVEDPVRLWRKLVAVAWCES